MLDIMFIFEVIIVLTFVYFKIEIYQLKREREIEAGMIAMENYHFLRVFFSLISHYTLKFKN